MYNYNTLLTISTLTTFLGVVSAEGATYYGDSNATKLFNQKQHLFLNFFRTDCHWSKSFAPIYDDLADAFAEHSKDLIFGKINAPKNDDLRVALLVKETPSLYFLSKTGKDFETYEGNRDFGSIAAFIEERTGFKATRRPKTRVMELDSVTFEAFVLNSDKRVLVNFYAPWCQYCQKLAPIYKRVAQAFAGEPNCLLAEVDATASKALGQKYINKAFPTLLFFSGAQGKENPYEIYNGPREEQDIINYLNYKCKTYRTPGGGLLPNVGRLGDMEIFVKEFAEAAAKSKGLGKTRAREEVVRNATQVAKKHSSKYAQYYVKVLNRAVNGTEFFRAEKARLEGIVTGKETSYTVKDDFMIRLNILNAIESQLNPSRASASAPSRPENEKVDL